MRGTRVLLLWHLWGVAASPRPTPPSANPLVLEQVIHGVVAPILTVCTVIICLQWIATCRGLRSKDDLKKANSPQYQAFYFCGSVGLGCWAFRLWSIAIAGPVQFGPFRATTVFVRNMGTAIFSGYFFALVWTVLITGARIADYRVSAHLSMGFVVLWVMHVVSIVLSLAFGLAYDHQWGWCIGNVAGFLACFWSGLVLTIATARLRCALVAWDIRLAKSVTKHGNPKPTNLSRLVCMTALVATVAFSLCPLFVALFFLNIRNTDGFLLTEEAANRHAHELNAIYSIQTILQLIAGMGAAYYVWLPIGRSKETKKNSHKSGIGMTRGSLSAVKESKSFARRSGNQGSLSTANDSLPTNPLAGKHPVTLNSIIRDSEVLDRAAHISD